MKHDAAFLERRRAVLSALAVHGPQYAYELYRQVELRDTEVNGQLLSLHRHGLIKRAGPYADLRAEKGWPPTWGLTAAGRQELRRLSA